MRRFAEFLRRLSYLFRRSHLDRDLDDEAQFHLECRAQELQDSGVSPGAALAEARREFGPAARAAEESRAAWQFRPVEDLFSDLRYAARAFRRNPGFAFTAVACLALGIGANTTIFSIADEVLFSRPSVRDPDTLVRVYIGGNSASPLREFRFLRDAHIFAGLAGENEEAEANWRNGESTSRLSVVRVTDNFFEVTGIPVAMGHPILPGNSQSVVVTHGFWQRRLGADPDVIGSKLLLDGRVYTISGVLPLDHRTVTGFGFSPDLYVPADGPADIVTFFARLDPSMTRQEAYGRLKTACRELDRVYPDVNIKWAENLLISGVAGMDRVKTDGQMTQPLAAFFGMLMLVVGLVLLIACANVAGLLLARGSARSHELAVRLSIGAGRGRIVRQLLTESLLLAVSGTAAGLMLNILITMLLSRVRLPLPIPIQFLILPDWRLFAYAALVALGASLVSGLTPALQGTRAGISAILKRDTHQSGRGSGFLRNALVAGQLAVCIILLSAGFLFLRNLVAATSFGPGFDIEHTVWAYLRLVRETHTDVRETCALAEAAAERMRTLPGVDSAAVARLVPLNGNLTIGTGVHTDTAQSPVHVILHANQVGPSYFHVMQIPLLQGREFNSSDHQGSPKVVIINENLARRLFGAASAVGHAVWFEKNSPIQVVGVVANSKYFTLGEENAMAWYEPYAQLNEARTDIHILIRAVGRPETLISAIPSRLGTLDPTAALEVKPMHSALGFALLPSRAGAALLGSTGLLGLVLASIGLYGVLLYSVSRRIREIGLRMALGASPGSIVGLVMRHGAVLTGIGVSIGIAIAAVAVRPLAMFLIPGIRPADPANFVVAGLVLALVSLAATVSPALKALRVDPAEALRHD